MSTAKQQRNRQRHEFLLTFFDLPHKYEEKQINNWWLIRQFNASSNPPAWEVAIYPKDHFISKKLNGVLFQEEAETK
jgi:hypothetical protein